MCVHARVSRVHVTPTIIFRSGEKWCFEAHRSPCEPRYRETSHRFVRYFIFRSIGLWLLFVTRCRHFGRDRPEALGKTTSFDWAVIGPGCCGSLIWAVCSQPVRFVYGNFHKNVNTATYTTKTHTIITISRPVSEHSCRRWLCALQINSAIKWKIVIDFRGFLVILSIRLHFSTETKMHKSKRHTHTHTHTNNPIQIERPLNSHIPNLC